MRHVLALVLMLFSSAAMAGEPQPFVAGSWQKIRDAQQGKPTIIHFWGVTCAVCLAELSDWTDLTKEVGNTSIVFIAADPVLQDEQRVQRQLTKAGLAAADNWMFADAFTERLRFEIDPRWGGELPRTILIAADGKTEVLTGAADFAALKKWSAAQRK